MTGPIPAEARSIEFSPWKRKLIACVQLIGGGAGVLLISQLSLSSGLSLYHRFIFGLLAIPFLVAAYAGKELWIDSVRGYKLSIAVQVLQIGAWSSVPLLYNFAVGLQAGIWFGPGILAPLGQVGARLDIHTSPDPSRGEAIGVNFIACWALYKLVQGWQARCDRETQTLAVTEQAS